MKRWSFVGALLAVSACQGKVKPLESRVEVGVFFGGQIQRLDRIEVPTMHPPKFGFRVHLPGSAEQPKTAGTIDYEIVRPGPVGRRVTEKGTLRVSPGQERIDQVLSLEPSHRLGLWNVRVMQGQKLLADRALYLVTPSSPSP